MENKPLEQLSLDDLNDVTGGGCVRTAILGAGAAIGMWTSGCAIGPMAPGPSTAPASITCPVGQR